MTVQDVLLPDAVPLTDTVSLTDTWEIDVERCAAEVSYRILATTIWRARLRPIEVRIVRAGPDDFEVFAVFAARPSYASVPGTRGLFRRHTRRQQLRVTGPAEQARISLGPTRWPTRYVVRFTEIGDDRAIASLAGVVLPRPGAPTSAGDLDYELAAEFVRCG